MHLADLSLGSARAARTVGGWRDARAAASSRPMLRNGHREMWIWLENKCDTVVANVPPPTGKGKPLGRARGGMGKVSREGGWLAAARSLGSLGIPAASQSARARVNTPSTRQGSALPSFTSPLPFLLGRLQNSRGGTATKEATARTTMAAAALPQHTRVYKSHHFDCEGACCA